MKKVKHKPRFNGYLARHLVPVKKKKIDRRKPRITISFNELELQFMCKTMSFSYLPLSLYTKLLKSRDKLESQWKQRGKV